MIELRVALEPNYPIYIAKNALETVRLPEQRLVLLADERIAPLYAPALKQQLESQGARVEVLMLPSGEACKTLQVHAELLSKLAQLGFTRDSAVLALGGGATSDLAGYVAASYLRGVAFYVFPTSLLAMVDASVGGKTGVNLPEGKNLVGAFHQPKAVWMDTNTLQSLPEAQFREGAAELFKHGLLANPKLCGALLGGLTVQSPELEHTIAAAVQVKINIVQRDPFEKLERAYLNFGHTLAHALEALTEHRLPHGEAVGYGMHYAALLGKQLGYTDLTEHTWAFLEYQRPHKLPQLEWAALRSFMASDKQADLGGVRFVLLEEIAKPKLERVPEAALEAAFVAFCHASDKICVQ
ncbi:MAG: 3-dehydroquinate synthase [Deinococcales bacterium]